MKESSNIEASLLEAEDKILLTTLKYDENKPSLVFSYLGLDIYNQAKPSKASLEQRNFTGILQESVHFHKKNTGKRIKSCIPNGP